MKERLNELTLAQFIDLVCGDRKVLLDDGDCEEQDVLQQKASEFISSYRLITDSAGMKSDLLEKEEAIKDKAKILFFRICHTLIAYKSYADIRELLHLIDLDADDIADEQLAVFIEEQARYAIFEQHRNEEMRSDTREVMAKRSEEDIRAGFDSEIAFVMSHFKMHIDMHQINAAVYANIVNQVNADIMTRYPHPR